MNADLGRRDPDQGSGKLSLAIVMCTYNGAAYIEKQLSSIAAQSRLPDSMFVCDDGSTDATLSLLSSFSESAPFPVHVRRNPDRLGYNANFAAALAEPDTDLIALCDQDDIWHRDNLSTLWGLLEDAPLAGAASGDARCVDDDGKPVGKTIWEWMNFSPHDRGQMARPGEFGPLLRHNVISGHCTVMRSSFRDLVLPFSEHGFYDYWMAVLIQSVSRLVFAPEPLSDYRIHGDNAVGFAGADMSVSRVARQWLSTHLGSRSEHAASSDGSIRSHRKRELREKSEFSRELLERVSESHYQITEESRQKLERWAEFSLYRSQLPPHVLSRARAVSRELRSGGYTTHARLNRALYDALLG